jgi:aspartyl-tRNA(Asn)/glutamyl-tRNA(Gln) amidotransferase subunit B
LRQNLPELPDEKKARFVRDFALSAYDADVLVAERERAEYYEEIVKGGADPKAAANWLINEYLGRLYRPSEQRHGMPTVNPTAAT